MIRRALRTFWWLYWPAIAFYVSGTVLVANGPQLQRTLAPTHVFDPASGIVRTPDQLCWTYSGRKLRATGTDDLDTYLHSDGIESRMVVAPYGEVDGLPWRKSAASAVGRFSKRYCITLPSGVPDDKGLRFELTGYYPGLMGLWRMPVPWPVVAADGLPAVPAPSAR